MNMKKGKKRRVNRIQTYLDQDMYNSFSKKIIEMGVSSESEFLRMMINQVLSGKLQIVVD